MFQAPSAAERTFNRAFGLLVGLLSAYLARFRLTVQRYFPVKAGAPPAEFVPIAGRYPVFELRPAASPATPSICSA